MGVRYGVPKLLCKKCAKTYDLLSGKNAFDWIFNWSYYFLIMCYISALCKSSIDAFLHICLGLTSNLWDKSLLVSSVYQEV